MRKTKSSGQSQSHIATDDQSVSKSWCRAPSGAHDQIFITVRQLRSCFFFVPAQSFSGQSHLGLATIFYCLRFETSILVASYDYKGHGGGQSSGEN
jgi:hypothetical protein